MGKKSKSEKDEEKESKEIGIPASHLVPQAETDGPPPRPKAVDPKHLKPQE